MLETGVERPCAGLMIAGCGLAARVSLQRGVPFLSEPFGLDALDVADRASTKRDKTCPSLPHLVALARRSWVPARLGQHR
jgi:hypothetical protein